MSAKEILSRYNLECFFVFVFCFLLFLEHSGDGSFVIHLR